MKSKFIISNYRDSAKEQFVLEIVKECIYMGERAFVCKLADFSPFKDIIIDSSPIRASLVGSSDNLYSYYFPKFVQLTLF